MFSGREKHITILEESFLGAFLTGKQLREIHSEEDNVVFL